MDRQFWNALHLFRWSDGQKVDISRTYSGADLGNFLWEGVIFLGPQK